ncbi:MULTISPECIES: MFS transporter [Micrococcaceae]|uniref:MFS transporter n=1 Tax=Micrococcaceae TaxID=1268 RepID=UPI00160DA2E6|nr:MULTISPECIES: MFS transporter [Micrococcaceae]MBB5750091.1 MFS family permease [Micrococcus sp. TA1]HRO94848.1 MFS transporter [Citricoccus sp.]
MADPTLPATGDVAGTHALDARKATPQARKAALASWLGSTLEYYDFFIYGTAAALIFNRLFFPEGDPVVATVAAMATFGAGYLARPIGGLVMGHVGDRIGRRTALMITLVIMGVASTAIGLLPTYDAVGVWATALLLLCRLAQGFSAGAEAAGAATMTLEHAPQRRRAEFSSSVMMGYASGMVLSNLVFIPIALLPDDQFTSWGWRVPFLVSVVVLVVAYWVRTKLEETPVFEEQVEGMVTSGEPGAHREYLAEAAIDRTSTDVPALLVLRTQWQDVVRIVFITLFSVIQTIVTVYGLQYAVNVHGIDRTAMLTINVITVGLSMVSIPLAARMADRIGRKATLFIGAVGCVASIWGFFWAIGEQDLILIFVFAFINQSIFYSCWNGVWPAFFPEMFAAPVRYTGMAMGNQIGLILTGFAPTIAAVLAQPGALGWIPVAVFVTLAVGISCLAIATARETYKVPTAELGPARARSAFQEHPELLGKQ